MTERLNIVGAGSAARVLARLWSEREVFSIGGICNRTMGSAREAAGFIGAGRAVANAGRLEPAPVWMLGCPDDQLAAVAAQLRETGQVARGSLVFHLSGVHPASVLQALDARLGSFHPVCSFADPERAISRFAGSMVAVEGENGVRQQLAGWAELLDARSFVVAGANKPLYHAASVTAANHTVALLDQALQLYRHAGLEEPMAKALVRSLAQGSVANVTELGPEQALTGPVVRGDVATVAAHLQTLAGGHREGYLVLARAALDLARRSGRLDPAVADEIEKLLL